VGDRRHAVLARVKGAEDDKEEAGDAVERTRKSGGVGRRPAVERGVELLNERRLVRQVCDVPAELIEARVRRAEDLR
jgi:hypothetical protein